MSVSDLELSEFDHPGSHGELHCGALSASIYVSAIISVLTCSNLWSLAHGHLNLVHNGESTFILIVLPAITFGSSILTSPHYVTVLVAAATTMLDVTSANSTGVESNLDLLNDRIDLIAATTLIGVTYGIVTTLYCMTTFSLLKKLFRRNVRFGSHSNSSPRPRKTWRKTLFYLAYTTVLFVLATLYTAGNSQNAIVAYVDNRLYPGGAYQYFITFMAGQRVMVMTDITALIILWMTDALILCRFIMFYYKVPYARWIIPLPCAMYVGVVVLSTLVLQGEAGLGKIFYLSENLMLAYYTLSFSLSVLATVLIAARLYWHKIQLERVFGPRVESPYMSIATMLIESAALYGAWSLVFLVLCIQGNPGQTIILATITQIQVIAPLLIILWIARDKAWNHTRSYGEDDDDDDDESPGPRRSSGGGRSKLGLGSRCAHGVAELGLGGDRDSDTNRNASWSTVVGEGGTEKRDGEKDEDDINVDEHGLCDSKPPSVIGDIKA